MNGADIVFLAPTPGRSESVKVRGWYAVDARDQRPLSGPHKTERDAETASLAFPPAVAL